MTEPRDIIANLVIHKYLRDTNPTWTNVDESVIRPRYWSFRKANPSVEHLEQGAADLGHPNLPGRIEQLANEFRDWLKNPYP
jgi:hypothetical protein